MRKLQVLWALPLIGLAMLMAGCDSEGDQQEAQEKAQAQAALSEDQVTSFIATFPAIRAVGENYAKQVGGDPANPYGAAMAQIKASRGYEEFAAAIEKQGFDDIEQWAAVANRVTLAYAAIKLEAQGAQMKAQLEAARRRAAVADCRAIPVDLDAL